MKRALGSIGLALGLVLAACGGDGGPTAPSAPNVSGVYTGSNQIVTNTCTGEVGALTGVRSVSVTQNGSSIRITLAGTQLDGTIQPNGAFSASGSEVVEGVTVSIQMDGSITGDRLLATETGTFSAQGESCTIVISFNMTRES